MFRTRTRSLASLSLSHVCDFLIFRWQHGPPKNSDRSERDGKRWWHALMLGNCTVSSLACASFFFLLDDFSTTLKLGACRVKMGKRRRNIIYTKYRSKKRNRSEGDGRDGEKESGVSDATWIFVLFFFSSSHPRYIIIISETHTKERRKKKPNKWMMK